MAFCEEWSPWEKCKPSKNVMFLLGNNSSTLTNILYFFRLLTLSLYLAVASALAWSFVPRFLKLMMQLSSQVSQFMKYQLSFFYCIFLIWFILLEIILMFSSGESQHLFKELVFARALHGPVVNIYLYDLEF